MDTIRNLMQALYQAVGNKRYMSDIEELFKNVELTPQQKQALVYLAQDIRQLDLESKRNNKRFF